MTVIPNPSRSVAIKQTRGNTDVSNNSGRYRIMGATILSVNATVGFNGQPSSLNLTLVEDIENGDSFITPDIPSVWAVSFPKGGVGIDPLDGSLSTLPNGFNSTNFYFCGICTSWTRLEENVRGKTISITLTDPRELMSGVQCLLNGFALSQTIGTGSPRFTGVENIIDIFGYFNYGMESDRNEFGMEWSKIRQAIESARVQVNDIAMEFSFTGDAFNNVPSYYRIPDETVDLVGLLSKVTKDGGSDFLTIGRKISSTVIVVEIRGIRRTDQDVLKKSEMQTFVNARSEIVSTFDFGREYRNQPTSDVIIGGPKNSNYVALPTTYDEEMHINPSGNIDYNVFPDSISERLITSSNVDSGAIYPFWGFAPNSTQYPMIEPFLPLDHLALDYRSGVRFFIYETLPQNSIGVTTHTVRSRSHQDVFLSGDGDSDNRPFAFVQETRFGSADIPGYIRGLPLNTEVLKASLVSELQFWTLYRLYYPDIAENMDIPAIDFSKISASEELDLLDITHKLDLINVRDEYRDAINGLGNIFSKSSQAVTNLVSISLERQEISIQFRTLIYDLVRRYAEQHLGKQFMVMLPKSNIMQRIWSGQAVPTREERPEIEYKIDSVGFWENTPTELDGFQDPSGSAVFSASEELEIRRRFMAEDGRFRPMIGVDLKPSGNAGFYANGRTSALFQDLSVSDYRPNRIANKNDLPPYIFVSPGSIGQLSNRRPDVALVNLTTPIRYNPTDNNDILADSSDFNIEDDVTLINVQSIANFLMYFNSRDTDFQTLITNSAALASEDYDVFLTKVVKSWSKKIYGFLHSKLNSSLEYVMDFKGIIIPLTSNWVTYGPWYASSNDAKGKVQLKVDPSLVPWNFNPEGDGQAALGRLDSAGNERLSRSISVTEYLDKATVVTAGFPELSLASNLGFNSNLTGLNVSFGIGGVTTTYNFATYIEQPGTFRKSDFDDLSRVRIDTRPPIVDTLNINLRRSIQQGTDAFF